MSDYVFYARMLGFVAAKTEPSDPRMAEMMELLRHSAAEIAAGRAPVFAPDQVELAARAFAGVAAFLQKQILPETVAYAHQAAEREVRWAIDTAMDAVNLLLSRAALAAGQPVALSLPPPP